MKWIRNVTPPLQGAAELNMTRDLYSSSFLHFPNANEPSLHPNTPAQTLPDSFLKKQPTSCNNNAQAVNGTTNMDTSLRDDFIDSFTPKEPRTDVRRVSSNLKWVKYAPGMIPGYDGSISVWWPACIYERPHKVPKFLKPDILVHDKGKAFYARTNTKIVVAFLLGLNAKSCIQFFDGPAEKNQDICDFQSRVVDSDDGVRAFKKHFDNGHYLEKSFNSAISTAKKYASSDDSMEAISLLGIAKKDAFLSDSSQKEILQTTGSSNHVSISSAAPIICNPDLVTPSGGSSYASSHEFIEPANKLSRDSIEVKVAKSKSDSSAFKSETDLFLYLWNILETKGWSYFAAKSIYFSPSASFPNKLVCGEDVFNSLNQVIFQAYLHGQDSTLPRVIWDLSWNFMTKLGWQVMQSVDEKLYLAPGAKFPNITANQNFFKCEKQVLSKFLKLKFEPSADLHHQIKSEENGNSSSFTLQDFKKESEMPTSINKKKTNSSTSRRKSHGGCIKTARRVEKNGSNFSTNTNKRSPSGFPSKTDRSNHFSGKKRKHLSSNGNLDHSTTSSSVSMEDTKSEIVISSDSEGTSNVDENEEMAKYSFNNVWSYLKSQGWTTQPPRQLDIAWNYCMPGVSRAKGKQWIDYFNGGHELQKYAIDHELFGPVSPTFRKKIYSALRNPPSQ